MLRRRQVCFSSTINDHEDSVSKKISSHYPVTVLSIFGNNNAIRDTFKVDNRCTSKAAGLKANSFIYFSTNRPDSSEGFRQCFRNSGTSRKQRGFVNAARL